jgi:signal transduction histidine kinase
MNMTQHSGRILLVEDTPDTIRMLSTILTDAGYQTLVATTAEKALERVELTQPDVILLDILLPGMDGYDICRQLKARESTHAIPVIFMSALHEPFDKVKGFQLGAVDYVTKPIEPEELLARVQTHITIYRLRRELEDSLEELRKTQDDLVRSAKMAVLGSLVAGVAHEINTPIGICVTATSYLDQQTKNMLRLYNDNTLKRSDLEGYLHKMSESSHLLLMNLRRVADQIQAFKQVAVDQTVLEKRRFMLKPYLEDVILSLTPKLRHLRHTLILTCPDALEIDSYPDAFFQILTNFVTNSLLHAFDHKECGEMRLEVTTASNLVQLRYSDNGQGMTPPEIARIFEPFYTTKRGQGGSGLGLHIVYNLVTQKLKGDIQCESTPDVGTTFIIHVPLE